MKTSTPNLPEIIRAHLLENRAAWPLTASQIAYGLARADICDDMPQIEIARIAIWSWHMRDGVIPPHSVALPVVTAAADCSAFTTPTQFMQSMAMQGRNPKILRQRGQARFLSILCANMTLAEHLVPRVWPKYSVPVHSIAIPWDQGEKRGHTFESISGEAACIAACPTPTTLLVVDGFDVRLEEGVMSGVLQLIEREVRLLGGDLRIVRAGVTPEQAARAGRVFEMPAAILGHETHIIDPESLPPAILADIVEEAVRGEMDMGILGQATRAAEEEEERIKGLFAAEMGALAQTAPTLDFQTVGNA